MYRRCKTAVSTLTPNPRGDDGTCDCEGNRIEENSDRRQELIDDVEFLLVNEFRLFRTNEVIIVARSDSAIPDQRSTPTDSSYHAEKTRTSSSEMEGSVPLRDTSRPTSSKTDATEENSDTIFVKEQTPSQNDSKTREVNAKDRGCPDDSCFPFGTKKVYAACLNFPGGKREKNGTVSCAICYLPVFEYRF